MRQQRWVRWTVVVIVVLVAAALALSAVPSHAAAASGRTPPVDAEADYQLGGAYPVGAEVGIVTRDRTEHPAGRYDICYLNAFQTQPDELDWWHRHHPHLLLWSKGHLVRDPGWPDEALLDTRTAGDRSRIAAILGRWATGCADDGYEGLEPDNLDSWTRSGHLLTRAGNLDLAHRLAHVAHRHGLAVAQKNTAELTASQARRAGFDFAVAEDCRVYDECGRYQKLYRDHVIEVEYADEGRASFEAACADHGESWSVVYRDRDLVAPDEAGYVRDAC